MKRSYRTSRKVSNQSVPCKFCGLTFKRQGIGPHMLHCLKRDETISKIGDIPSDISVVPNDFNTADDSLILDQIWNELSVPGKVKLIASFLSTRLKQ